MAKKKKGKKPKKWIKGAIKRPGALRAKAGVKKGQKIPAEKLKAMTKSKNPRTRRQANLAKTLRKFKRKRKKK